MNNTLSPAPDKSFVDLGKKKDSKIFTTKQIKEHHLNCLDMSLQVKNKNKMNKTFYSSNKNLNCNSTASNFLRKSKQYENESNTIIMSRVKSDLPEINHFYSSAERSEKTSKGISSSQIMKSGASLKDLKKIKSLR